MRNTCYVKNAARSEPQYSGDQAPCANSSSSIVSCCNPTDTCGRDGFCHFTHSLDAPVTGYYLGGCTDATFADPACPQHCTGFYTQDVIYSESNGLWACCYGSGELDCRVPSNETFAAAGPAVLFASTSCVPSRSSWTMSSSTRGQTSTAASKGPSTKPPSRPGTETPSTANESGSSDNNRVIVTAVTVPVVVIAAAVLGFLLWRRLQTAKKSGRQRSPGETRDMIHSEALREQEDPQHAALTRFEMAADREPVEVQSAAHKPGTGWLSKGHISELQ